MSLDRDLNCDVIDLIAKLLPFEQRLNFGRTNNKIFETVLGANRRMTRQLAIKDMKDDSLKKFFACPFEMARIIRSMSRLERLDMSGTKFKPFPFEVADAICSLINLKELDLTEEEISDEDVSKLISCLTNLKKINVKGCEKLTVDGLTKIFSSESLESVTAGDNWVGEGFLEKLGENIRELKLYNTLNSHKAAEKLGEIGGNLESLLFEYSNPNPGLIDPFDLSPLFSHNLRNLRKLKIVYHSCSNELRYNGIERLVSLKEIVIEASTRHLKNEDVLTITNNCPVSLRKLVLDYTFRLHTYVDDSLVLDIFNRLHDLEHFEILNIQEVSLLD